MVTDKRVAVIVLNLNGYAVTEDCIRSLQKVRYSAFDVILVDNGSTDGSGRALKHNYPHVELLESPYNAGFTGGNNLGLAYAVAAGYDYAMLLNNDTIVEPGFLEPLVKFMDANPEAGVLQSKIYFNHDRSLLWNAGSFYNQLFGFPYTDGLNSKSKPQFEQIREVDWVTGCAFMVRTAVLRQSGLLAANMFLYCEDVDLSFRIRQLGYKLYYVPASVIYHIAGVTGKSREKTKEGRIQPQIHYYNQRNRLWLLKRYTRWYCWPTVLSANILYVSAVLLYFAIRGRWQKFNAVTKAIRDGVTGAINYTGVSIPSDVSLTPKGANLEA